MRRPLAVLTALLLAAGLALVPGAAHATPGPAPAFTLELFNGQSLRLADLKGKAVVLLFWTEW
jgi:cytochrome oxidase Cu insertion factor (SCO1/SenC/PrrC family)